MAPRFRDRAEAGRELAAVLVERFAGEQVVVLGLPRGGVPVAAEIAAALHAPLDVFVVRKLGAPGQAELAMGAVASGGVRVLNDGVVRHLGVPPAALEEVTRKELAELERRERAYREERPPVGLTGTVVLVDDGLATGASMRAAVLGVRAAGAERVVVAVPVGASDSCARLREIADEVICLRIPAAFGAVGSYYRNFTQTTDDEVRRLLAR